MASIESPSSSLSASRQQAPTASFRAGAARGGGSDPSCHTLLILRDLYPSPSVVLAFLESRLKAISEDAYVAAVSSNNVVDPKPARFAKDRYVLDSASVTRDAHDGRDMLVECRLPPHHQEGVSVRFEILYRPLTGPAKRAPTRDEWSRCVAAFGASMPDALGEGGGGGGDPTQSAQAQAQRQSEEASSASAAAGSTSGRRGQEEEEEPRRQTMTADEAVKGQEDADAGEEEEDLVAATPHLRLFQVYSAGVGHLEGSRYWRQLNRERSKRSEHVRDTKGEMGAAGGERNGDAANKQEEQVWASAAGIHVVPIAEHVIGTVLSLFHAFPRLIRAAASHEWIPMPDIIPNADRGGFFIRELRGRTMGVLGYGHIGRECARMAKALGMRVVAANRKGERQRIGGYLVDGTGDCEGDIPERWFSTESRSADPDDPKSMFAFYATCDVVVNTLPSSAATRGFVDRQAFETMRDDAVFVNIGRGDTVDQEAMIEALQAGLKGQHATADDERPRRLCIGSASLDVTTPEPLPASSPLWSLPNVLLTPHMSGGSELYWFRACDLFAINVWRVVVQGKGALNAVRGKGE